MGIEDAVRAHKEGRVYVLSYGWLRQGCADPHGLYLKAVLRFLGSLGTRAAACGLFWDYACLPQWPRTADEEKLFKTLLNLMGNLYGSMWRTTVLQHKLVPYLHADAAHSQEEEEYNVRAYDDRGWCTFEQGAARLAAGHRLKRDRATLGAKQPKLIEISGHYPHVVDVEEPPTLESIETAIQQAKFTGEGDSEKVMGMIKTFNALLMVSARQQEALAEVAEARRHELDRGRGLFAQVFGRHSSNVHPDAPELLT